MINMEWFDVFKNKNNKLAQEAYSNALGLIERIQKTREQMLDHAEEIADGLVGAGLNRKDSRDTARRILSPMFKDLDEREKALKKDLEFYMKEGMKE